MSDRYILKKDHLTGLLRRLMKEYRLVAPVRNQQGDTLFSVIDSIDQAAIDLAGQGRARQAGGIRQKNLGHPPANSPPRTGMAKRGRGGYSPYLNTCGGDFRTMVDVAFAKPVLPKSGALVLLIAEDEKPSGLWELADEATQGAITRAFDVAEFKGGKARAAPSSPPAPACPASSRSVSASRRTSQRSSCSRPARPPKTLKPCPAI